MSTATPQGAEPGRLRVTFTCDVEDHRPHPDMEPRFPRWTRVLLEFLGSRGVRGSFFIVAELAREQGPLIREIAEAGHEIGLHGLRHVPLTQLSPAEFEAETREGKEILEDLIGRAVGGYRAPIGSLVPATVWAAQKLPELGFSYSSSVVPTRTALYGFPGAPQGPFRWPSGLAEFPTPLFGLGPLQVPLGGVYLRVLPWRLVLRAIRQRPDSVYGVYCHPYDFDVDEPYWVEPHAGFFGSPLLWFNRRAMLPRVERLLGFGHGPPLGERLGEATRTFEAGAAGATS